MGHDFTFRYVDSSDEARELGLIGEHAVAKATAGYVNDTDCADNGIDVVTASGTLIDVKTTNYDDGHLLVRSSRKNCSNADVYVLVVVDDEDEPDIRGALTADEVYAKRPRRWPKGHLNHIFTQDELVDLLALLQQNVGD